VRRGAAARPEEKCGVGGDKSASKGVAYFDCFDGFPLQTETQQHGTLDGTQAYITAKSFLKIQRCSGWQEIHDDVIVQCIVGVGLEPFQIKRC
jgi:hypothetical protein